MSIEQDRKRYEAPTYQKAYEATGKRGVLVFAPNMWAFQAFCSRHPGEAHAAVYTSDVRRLMGIDLDHFIIAQVDGWGEHPHAVELEERLRALMTSCTSTPFFLEAGLRYRR